MRRTTFSLKLRLLAEPGLVVTDVPRVLGKQRDFAEPKTGKLHRPRRGRHRRLAPGLRYAETLGLPRHTHALFLAFDEADARRDGGGLARTASRCRSRSSTRPTATSGGPLLARLRQITAEPDAVAVVVMPELVVRGVDRLLHNQRALYLKRLLLFEPNVILASVPYQFV